MPCASSGPLQQVSPFYPYTTTTPVSIPISCYRLDLTHLWTERIRLNKGSSLDPLHFLYHAVAFPQCYIHGSQSI